MRRVSSVVIRTRQVEGREPARRRSQPIRNELVSTFGLMSVDCTLSCRRSLLSAWAGRAAGAQPPRIIRTKASSRPIHRWRDRLWLRQSLIGRLEDLVLHFGHAQRRFIYDHCPGLAEYRLNAG